MTNEIPFARNSHENLLRMLKKNDNENNTLQDLLLTEGPVKVVLNFPNSYLSVSCNLVSARWPH